jgi:hypothetical protein
MFMAVRYRLVFRGKYLPGLGPEQVAANLAALFGVTLEQAQQLLAASPAVIKQDVDVEQGNRYLEALLEAGLITHLEALTDAEGKPLPAGWDGVERRVSLDRRTGHDRRGGNRDASMRPDRRHSRGRRKTDHEPG